jgi:hypothetical protein
MFLPESITVVLRRDWRRPQAKNDIYVSCDVPEVYALDFV